MAKALVDAERKQQIQKEADDVAKGLVDAERKQQIRDAKKEADVIRDAIVDHDKKQDKITEANQKHADKVADSVKKLLTPEQLCKKYVEYEVYLKDLKIEKDEL